MLSQIVRPMVRTQIRLLASSQATRTTLINTIAQWLGFLGVQARVTHLESAANQIQVSLTVGQPEGCDTQDWQKILSSLDRSHPQNNVDRSSIALDTPQQQRKLQRLLAYVIQVGHDNRDIQWDALYPQLRALGLEESLLLGVRSALKVPQSLDQLLEGLDPDVAAVALPKAVSIALLDRQVNDHEDKALSALLDAMRQPTTETTAI